MDKNDRFLYNEEVISLLKELNIITNNMYKLEDKILSILNTFTGHFGNPYDKESMNNLFGLLKKFNVDLNDDKNKRIIYGFLFNKGNGKKIVNKLEEFNLVKKVKRLDASDKDVDNYVTLLSNELGLKPNNMGFILFKECVVYLYYNSSLIKSSKDIYLYLSRKYNIDVKSVERVIRQNLNVSKNNHLDNEVSTYIYEMNESKRVVDVLFNTVSYMNNQDEFIVLKENQEFLCELVNRNLEMDNIIEIILNKLNVSNELVGYNYLVDLIYYVLNEDNIYLISWTKMYHNIALKYNKSSMSVERDIRFLIDSSYFKRSNDEVSKYIYDEQKRSSISKFVSNVVDYIKLINKENRLDNELEQNVRYLLHKMGFSSNGLGYSYLIDVIMLAINSDGLVSWGNLYETVGKKYGINYSKVERGIRNSIEKFQSQFLGMSYEEIINNKSISDVVKFLYRYCDDFSNSLFISLVVQYIKLTNSKSYINYCLTGDDTKGLKKFEKIYVKKS